MCPVDHEAARGDATAFSQLQQIGEQYDEDDDGRPAPLLLANCRGCGSTIARRKDPTP